MQIPEGTLIGKLYPKKHSSLYNLLILGGKHISASKDRYAVEARQA